MKTLDELGIVNHGPMVAVGTCESYDGGLPNARLIAAAPEMYEALHEAVVEFCHECPHCTEDCTGCKLGASKCFVQRWRAALAKAAGEEVAE